MGYLQYFESGMPWYVLAILASFIAIMIHALLAALGKAFALHELERYAQSEMLQGAATLLMVGFIVAMVGLAQAFVAQYFFGVTDPTQPPRSEDAPVRFECGGTEIGIVNMESSLDLLKCRMQQRATVFAGLQNDIAEAANWPLWQQSIYLSLLGFPVVQGAYFGALFKEIETYRILINFTTNMLIATNTMLVMTEYIKNNMLTLFLPLGLLLRSFHFTRGTGAFFIAMALGFYFVFPLLYIITDPAYVRPGGYNLPMPPITAAPMCYPTFSGIVHQLMAPPGGGGGIAAGSAQISLDDLKSDLARVYLTVVLHPFIIFSITLVFVRQLMYLLGGEAQDLMRMATKLV